MQLKACTCRVEYYRRGHRAWWMRLISNRRLFHCYGCDAMMFIDPGEVNQRLRCGAQHPQAPHQAARAVALNRS